MRSFKFSIIVATLAASGLISFALGARGGSSDHRAYLPLVLAYRSKIGIAPGGYSAGDLDLMRSPWVYHWNNIPFTDSTPVQIDMIWGKQYLSVTVFSNVILEANEPDRSDQANLNPLQGAQFVRAIEALYPDRVLISPSPSQDSDWLIEMVNTYRSLYGSYPRFDGIGLHYYRWLNSQPDLESFVKLKRSMFEDAGLDAPIWLTEWGACGEVDAVQEFRRGAEFIEKTPWIERAFWYKLRPDAYDPSPCSALIGPANTLTAVGEAYRQWVAPDD